MQSNELPYILKEIFKPTAAKVVLAVIFAALGHFYLVESALRDAGLGEFSAGRDFWLTNFISSLPYLETDSKVLKFITFFVASYALVWIAGNLFRILEGLQAFIIKLLRRSA